MCDATSKNAHASRIGKESGPRTRPEDSATSMCPDGSMSLRVKHLVGLHWKHSGFASGMSVKTMREAFTTMPFKYTSLKIILK